ncbi:MAG: hypothetical protein QW290_04945 [Sulfolobales archaeon]
MPARRRRTLSRSPVQRAKLWDVKMKPDVYAEYLNATKPLALPSIASYQATHEHLISTVREILSKNPSEYPVMHEYMWYAEKLWKLGKTYTSKALQLQVDALYIWYLARGLNDVVLRAIASALGIKVSPVEDIVDRVIAPMLLRIVGKGSITTDGTEQTMFEYIGLAMLSGYVDLSNMTDGDTVVIKTFVKIREDGEYKKYAEETFTGRQESPALYFIPRLTAYAYKVVIHQTAGSFKTFDYLFTKVV